jgi:hypothetical protein
MKGLYSVGKGMCRKVSRGNEGKGILLMGFIYIYEVEQ